MRRVVLIVAVFGCVAPRAGWRRVSLGDTRVSIETPGDAMPFPVAATRSMVLIQEGPAFRVDVYAGPDESLDAWHLRERLTDAHIEDSAELTICGAVARKLVVVQSAQAVEVFEPSNHHEVIPGRTMVVVAFTRAGIGVTAIWRVDSDRREAVHTAEQRFFDSIRCD